MDDVNHKISKEIVETAKHRRYKIAIENLTGLRQGNPSQKLREMLNRWAYRDLMDKIEYKLRLQGYQLNTLIHGRLLKSVQNARGRTMSVAQNSTVAVIAVLS
jgi:IS605 OrfB family transposase